MSAGWDVRLFGDDGLIVSRGAATEQAAQFIATAFKQDQLRNGWTDV